MATTPIVTLKPSGELKTFIAGHVFLTLCLCALLVMIFRAYRQERADLATMRETVAIQQQAINAQTVVIDQADARIAQRDAANQQAIAALQKVKTRKPNAIEAAQEIAKYLNLPTTPEAPPAIPATGGTADEPTDIAGAAGHAAPVLPVTGNGSEGLVGSDGSILYGPTQVEGLRQAAVNCAENEIKLADCKQDSTDRDSKIAALEAQAKVIASQRDAAIHAAKGGSFFTRLKREAKDVAIGVAVGAAVGYAAHR